MAFAFLIIGDFDTRITEIERDAITGNVDSILETIERDVLEEVKALTNNRFDMDAEFALSGANRSSLLVRFVLDIVIYEALSRNKPRQIPEFRVKRADDARDFMEAVGKPRSNVNPGWTKKEIDQGTTSGRDRVGTWGSYDRQDTNLD